MSKLRRLKGQRRNAVNREHARIVLLSAGRTANRRIAQLLDCSIQWVRQVIHRFNAHGIDGITWSPWFQARSARVFTSDICEQIADIPLSSPIALIGMTQWSLPTVQSLTPFSPGLRCVVNPKEDQKSCIGGAGNRAASCRASAYMDAWRRRNGGAAIG